MKIASISETKNNLSRLLDAVRRGETILIMDRRVPVARIEPVGVGQQAAGLAALVADGIVTAPDHALDVDAFLARPALRLPPGASAVHALIADREDSP